MTITGTVTKHDIGRRYTKIVRKILRLSEKLVEAETGLMVAEDYFVFGDVVDDAQEKASLARSNLESYVHQSLKEFRELIEASNKPSRYDPWEVEVRLNGRLISEGITTSLGTDWANGKDYTTTGTFPEPPEPPEPPKLRVPDYIRATGVDRDCDYITPGKLYKVVKRLAFPTNDCILIEDDEGELITVYVGSKHHLRDSHIGGGHRWECLYEGDIPGEVFNAYGEPV